MPYLSSATLWVTHGAPIPQAETKPTSPPNRPAHAQVMLAPSQVTAAEAPQKEPMPANAWNPDRILRVGPCFSRHHKPIIAVL